MWTQTSRAALYLLALLYCFLGIAIVADVFMNAIETITSAQVEVNVCCFVQLQVKAWSTFFWSCRFKYKFLWVQQELWKKLIGTQRYYLHRKFEVQCGVEICCSCPHYDSFHPLQIANLTLMALGSSAPEILLSVIGVVFTLGEEADSMFLPCLLSKYFFERILCKNHLRSFPISELGPATIVGSAAFNLLCIR